MSFDIQVKGVSLEIHQKRILHDVTFELQPGQLTMVLGANGSGKSTLLKTLAKSMEPTTGDININGKSLKDIPLADYAKFRSVLTQQTNLSFQTKVEELILMGRYPHFQQVPNPQDLQYVESAISLFDLNSFRYRMYDTLSGGEQQRVQFARVYAQIAHLEDGALFLLDEPLTFLDIKHQLEFIVLIQKLVMEKNRSCLMVIHDVNLALKYGDYFLFMKEGRLIRQGGRDVWDEALVHEVFGIQSTLFQSGETTFFAF